MDDRLTRVSFSAVPGWKADDPAPALKAFRRSLTHLEGAKPYRTGAFGIDALGLAVLSAFLDTLRPGATEAARGFFEDHFTPFRVMPEQGASGFVTAYYEPEVAVSDAPDEIYRFPFYQPPTDLVEVDAANAPALAASGHAFGRYRADGIEPYPDRGEIERGLLEGRDLEIAWARDRIDVFFAHIQGSARLVYPDGQVRRIGYAAKNGHPFTAIGRVLIDLGEISREAVTMDRLRAWLADHPERQDEILWQNRSFIFFRETPDANSADGPVGAAKVPLTAGRSLAVDRLLHTFGTPFFIDAPDLRHLDGGRPFRRLMIAQDTGSAIVGPARGDIFVGSGVEAGQRAGSVRHAADFYMLVPNSHAGTGR